MVTRAGKSEEIITRIIPGPANVKIVQIAAGAEHSAFITGKEMLKFFSFGIMNSLSSLPYTISYATL